MIDARSMRRGAAMAWRACMWRAGAAGRPMRRVAAMAWRAREDATGAPGVAGRSAAMAWPHDDAGAAS